MLMSQGVTLSHALSRLPIVFPIIVTCYVKGDKRVDKYECRDFDMLLSIKVAG